ncbi:transcription factor grauzone-like [Cochliomyia hominivorax]
MSLKLCCSLCCTPCMEYKSLHDDCGECNEIYEITIKYFDPILLTENENTATTHSKGNNKVLCRDCWLHIKDFHEFHQTVINSRQTLQQQQQERQTVVQKSPLQIKLEEPEVSIVSLNDNYDDYLDIVIKNDAQDELNPIDENDAKILDNIEDEEKPLIELKRTHNNINYNEIDSDNEITKEVKEKPKSRKGRKPKSAIKSNKKSDIDQTLDTIETNENNETTETLTSENKYLSKAALEKAREFNDFIAQWKSILECDICNETFSNYDSLNFHFKNKHNIKCYVKCCERKFNRRCDLVGHIRVHVNPETHKCDICGKLSATKYNLKLHKKFVHERDKQFECKQCHKTFAQNSNLERHLLTHVTGSKDFKCEECGRAYVLEVQLKSHIKLVHSDNRICDQCGKTLPSLGALKTHVKEHHEIIEKPTYPCDECGTILGSRVSLKKHKAAYHNDGTTVYVCSICGKVAPNERALMNHRNYVHVKERIHKCPHCDKAFKRPKNLTEHIATHTGEDLYQCPHCPKTFKINTNYHDHRKKAHPVEWEQTRKNRLGKQKIDFEKVETQIVL